MAVTAKLFASFPENLGGGNTAAEGPMDILSDTLKVMLTTNLYTPNQTAHTVKADVTNEVTGTGYTAGGAALANKTWAASSLTTTLDADDTTWPSSTITADNAAVYDDTPTSPADPLILYNDFGGDQSTSGTTFQITWNASGLLTITVA